MDVKDFFDIEEKEATKELQGALAEAANKCKHLMIKKDNWEETELFRSVVEVIGEYAPISLLEALVSFYQKKLNKFQNDELLTLMDTAEISEMVLGDGTKLVVTEALNTTVKDTNKEKRIQWLLENDYGDVIKEVLTFAGKGELDQEIINLINRKGILYTRDSDVAPATLKSIIKKRREEEKPLPSEEVVKITAFRYVKIK